MGALPLTGRHLHPHAAPAPRTTNVIRAGPEAGSWDVHDTHVHAVVQEAGTLRSAASPCDSIRARGSLDVQEHGGRCAEVGRTAKSRRSQHPGGRP
jgi:hypothetical protein